MAFEFPDPALGHVVDRHRVEVVQFLSALLHGGDEIGLLQYPQVLADRLPQGWFTGENLPMLKELCRHIDFADELAVQIAATPLNSK